MHTSSCDPVMSVCLAVLQGYGFLTVVYNDVDVLWDVLEMSVYCTGN